MMTPVSNSNLATMPAPTKMTEQTPKKDVEPTKVDQTLVDLKERYFQQLQQQGEALKA